MKQTIYWLSKYLGIFALCRYLTQNNIRILAYHGIWLGEGHFGNFLYMSPGKFTQRMQLLKRLGYPVISLSEAITKKDTNKLPKCSTVITIDDGWLGTYQHMLPSLEKYKFPATVYITTYYCVNQRPVCNVFLQYIVTTSVVKTVDITALGIVCDNEVDLTRVGENEKIISLLQAFADKLPSDMDRQRFCKDVAHIFNANYEQLDRQRCFYLMSPDQINDLTARGVDVQLHTHRHRISTEGKYSIKEEILDNRAVLEPLTCSDLTHFCYPSGIYDKKVWPEMEEVGITSATTTDTGLVTAKSHRYALPRILDGENVTDIEFEAEMSGFNDIIRRLANKFIN